MKDNPKEDNTTLEAQLHSAEKAIGQCEIIISDSTFKPTNNVPPKHYLPLYKLIYEHLKDANDTMIELQRPEVECYAEEIRDHINKELMSKLTTTTFTLSNSFIMNISEIIDTSKVHDLYSYLKGLPPKTSITSQGLTKAYELPDIIVRCYLKQMNDKGYGNLSNELTSNLHYTSK